MCSVISNFSAFCSTYCSSLGLEQTLTGGLSQIDYCSDPDSLSFITSLSATESLKDVANERKL